MMNIQKGKFCNARLLNSEHGFVLINLIIWLPIIFSLLICMLIIMKAITSNIVIYVDNWILTQQMRNILEDITTEITYADEVSEYVDFAKKKTLVIATRRRATENSAVVENYLGYRKEGEIIYRCELYKVNDGSYRIESKQPLNSKNYFGNDNIEFNWQPISDNLYAVEIKGSTYSTAQQFNLKTIIIQRNNNKEVVK